MDYLKIEFDYLVDFLSSYKKKIEMCNSAGLFDNAKLFESFAIEICNLLFGNVTFKNLNNIKPNFPYFDLISSDGSIFIQVSTQQNCAEKIKSTIDNFKEKPDAIKGVKEIKFFLLESCDLSLIKSQTVNQIKFRKTKDIICLADIVKKIKNDPKFCNKLYDLINERERKIENDSAKVVDAIKNSKILIDKTISDKISNTYHISRTDLEKSLISLSDKCVLVIGNAGCGKSSLVKDILKNEDIVLFLRGEELAKGKSYLDLFDFDIEKTFEKFSENKINIFVDSLEYVVSSQLNIDLLVRILSISEKFENVKMYLTCRPSDLICLQYYLKAFKIKQFTVPSFSSEEIKELVEQFPSLKIIDSKYKSLLNTPFYADFIVSNIKRLGTIKNEEEFRKSIFEIAICLKFKCSDLKIEHSEVVQTVFRIAKLRSLNQSLYVNENEFKSDIINALLSSNIIIKVGSNIRFSFDIFEDIIFEIMISELFTSNKHSLETFFSELDNLGPSCFRRYSLWISNLLKESSNFEILNEILNSNLTNNWIKQTKIAISISEYSNDFLKMYLNSNTNNELFDFIKNINLNAFNLEFDEQTFEKIPNLSLIPIGDARFTVIQIIYDNFIKGNILFNEDIIQLLISSEKYQSISSGSLQQIITLAQFVIEKNLKSDCWSDRDSSLFTIIINHSDLTFSWFEEFMKKIDSAEYAYSVYKTKLFENLFSLNLERKLNDEPIIKFYCKFIFEYLTKKQGQNLYNLRGSKFGLNDIANDVDTFRTVPEITSCFLQIINANIFDALLLYIKLLNFMAENYSGTKEVFALYDFKEGKELNFINISDFYYAGWTDGCNLPYLIQDFAHLLIKSIKKLFDTISNDAELTVKLATQIKMLILNTSNNVGPLSFLVLIYYLLNNRCPSFGNELITSIELIMIDINRYAQLLPNAKAEEMKNIVAQSFGFPNYKNRYVIPFSTLTLKELIFNAQLVNETPNIIDYCYEKYSNNAEAIEIYRQLDVRKCEKKEINGRVLVKSYVSKHQGFVDPIAECNKFLAQKVQIMGKRMDCLKEAKDICDYIENLDDNIRIIFDKELMLFYIYQFSNKKLKRDEKNKISNKILQKYEEVLDNGKIPSFDGGPFLILLKHLKEEINSDIIIKTRKLVLKFLLSNANNVFISSLQREIVKIIHEDLEFKKEILNVFLVLAKLEKENKNFIEGICIKDTNLFSNRLNDLNLKYESQIAYISARKNLIIDNFSTKKFSKDIEYNIESYDIDFTINCLPFINFTSRKDIKLFNEIISCVLVIINNDYYNKKITFEQKYKCKKICCNLLENEETQDILLNALFDFIHSNSPSDDLLQWLCDIFVSFVPRFFDEKQDRAKYFRYLKKLEQRIEKIEDDLTKNILFSVFTFNSEHSAFGDWSNLDVSYSDFDISQMNYFFKKYGSCNINLFYSSIYRLHYEKMLPSLLISISESMNNEMTEISIFKNENCYYILKSVVSVSYVKYLYKIKQDKTIKECFENILNKMIKNGDSVASPILNNLILL